jgi:hypothetical protein
VAPNLPGLSNALKHSLFARHFDGIPRYRLAVESFPFDKADCGRRPQPESQSATIFAEAGLVVQLRSGPTLCCRKGGAAWIVTRL